MKKEIYRSIRLTKEAVDNGVYKKMLEKSMFPIIEKAASELNSGFIKIHVCWETE